MATPQWRRGRGRGRGGQQGTVLSVSRSGGFGNDGDSLKSFQLQEKYWAQISPKLDSVLSSKSQSKDDRPNILISLRKLREGVSASHRNDSFSRSLYSLSLCVSVLFESERDVESCISAVLDPSWTSQDALFVALLYLMVHSGVPRFLLSLKSIPNAKSTLGDEKFTWLRQFSSALNMSNYGRLYSLLKSTPPLIESRMESLSLQFQSFSTFSGLYESAVEQLLAQVSRKHLAWPILQSAYRELHLHAGSETRSWLSACLTFTHDDRLDAWISERERLGQIKRKEGLEGRWIVLKVR